MIIRDLREMHDVTSDIIDVPLNYFQKILQHYTVLYCTVQWIQWRQGDECVESIFVLYSRKLQRLILYGGVQYRTVYCTVQYRTILYDAVQYSIILDSMSEMKTYQKLQQV